MKSGHFVTFSKPIRPEGVWWRKLIHELERNQLDYDLYDDSDGLVDTVFIYGPENERVLHFAKVVERMAGRGKVP